MKILGVFKFFCNRGKKRSGGYGRGGLTGAIKKIHQGMEGSRYHLGETYGIYFIIFILN